MFSRITLSNLLPLLLALTAVGPRLVQGADILVTDGFSKCLDSESIKIERMQLRYDKGTNALQFDVAGSSDREQKIEAVLKISAYGRQIEEKRFDPCKEKIDVLCPVPKGVFRANSNITLDPQFAAMIPAIAFQVPDLDGLARLELRSLDTDEPLACVESVVTNGKTADQPAVSYVTAGMAAVALGLSAISAVGAAGAGGSTAGVSPNFGDVMFWFQSIATNGMLTVEYPPVYRSFAKNFAWSTGLIPWVAVQKSIDDFRESTGGNKTANGVEFLMNATLVYTKGGMDLVSKEETVTKRALKMANNLFARQTIDFEHTDGVTETPTEDTGEKSKIMHYVDGIQAYVEQMKIPSANTFMTVLLMFGILVATIAVCILLFKVILEIWALFASFPKRLTGFRKRYWSFLAGTIIRIILILYGTWTMYCLYQFTRGDSWGAHVLAALTLLIFTGILGFFIVKIFKVAREVKKSEGTPEALFLNKPYMRKYGLFYDQFKSNFWWVFVPLIVYAFTKAAFIALGDGHGMVQVAGQLGCELVLLVLLVWNRPFNTRAGNVLNIIISVVRVLSVLCILVFVQELGINTDAKTVTGVILIAIQSTLTAVLAVLLAINAIVIMCKDNPHEKRRKELEKQRAEHLAMRGSGSHEGRNSVFFTKGVPGLTNDGKGQYHATPTHDSFYPAPGGGNHHHPGADDVPMQQMHSFHHQYQQHNRSVSTGSGRTVRESLVMSAAMPAGSPYADYRGENHGMYEQYRGASPPGGVVEGYRGAAPRY